MASMKMFQIQFHTGFVPRNAATVKFAKYVGAAPWGDGRGWGTQTPPPWVGGRCMLHGGNWQVPRRAPAEGAKRGLLVVMARGTPSISGVGWRCLSGFCVLLLL